MTNPADDPNHSLHTYAQALEQEWKEQHLATDPVAVAKQVRSQLLGMAPAALANLAALLVSTESETMRYKCITYIIDNTLGAQLKIVAANAKAGIPGEFIDPIAALYADLGAPDGDSSTPTE